MAWFEVMAEADFVRDGRAVFKQGVKEIAVVRSPDGKLYAIDNRCPHRGVPIYTSKVERNIITCNGHFWQFDLNSGQCVGDTTGNFRTKVYKVKAENGKIWVQLSDLEPV